VGFAVAGAGLAGCGSGSSGPLGSELSYFPANSPLVVRVLTDPNSPAVNNAQVLLRRFPLAIFGESAALARLEQLGVNYNTDVRPLFGNPALVGVTSASARHSSRSQMLVAWVTKDADALARVTGALSGAGFRSAGSYQGAKLYESRSTAIAVNGATLLVGGSALAVTDALDRQAGGGGMTSDTYTRALAGLPHNSLLQAFGNLAATRVRQSRSAASTRRVPWIAAARTYGAAISATSSGINIQYRIDTTGRRIATSQLPFAPGTASAALAGNLPILVSFRDARQPIQFLQSTQQASNPTKYAAFLNRQAALRHKSGVDLGGLAALLSGPLMLASDTQTTLVRTTVRDPGAARRTLAKLATQPRAVFTTARSVSRAGGGFYVVQGLRQPFAAGIVGDQLLVGRASPAQLRAFAAAPSRPAGGHGALAFSIAFSQLLQVALNQPVPRAAQSVFKSLGDIVGWAASSTKAVKGTATLPVK